MGRSRQRDRSHVAHSGADDPGRQGAARDGAAPAVALVASALLSLTLLLPTAAESHAVLVRSVPAQRAVLEAPPTRVELWFNERLEPAYSRVSVLDEANTQVDLRDASVAADDVRRLSVSLPALAPGRYRVEFRVLSVDGHVVESKLTFTVKSWSRRTP
ncbi:MAG: copper-binding protein [Candidatus Rokuibacteriota bacterium]|nr:MAG: copper-binding protein [Candidatus Rokubacteria bacterium]